ncbi:MAG: hypothetical protein H8E38_04035 [SAR324 cluster bacterium]|nr:hypothetical protein [SAR324 cluster bacterium]MBL7035297.1 hypothetical protein [SAR324 cluster bacterium]
MTTDSSTEPLSQLDQQLELLCSFNLQVPCNPQGDFAADSFKKLLQSLKTTRISDTLRGTYHEEHLKKWKEYAQREFNEMGRINRLRLESLLQLSDEEMHKTMFEGLLLFDINPEDSPPLEVQEKTGKFSEDGKPVMHTLTFDVFKQGAIHGIDGLERFLPPASIKGEAGMDAHLEEEFAGTDIVSHFKQSSGNLIKALTTIGSLGGIGHKPDSDMDAQVIINTNPEFKYDWNDADYLISLVGNVIETFYLDYFNSGLKIEERLEIKKAATKILTERYNTGLSVEEQRVIEFIFASSFRKELRILILQHLQNRPAEEQKQFFQNSIISTLKKLPDCEDLLDPLCSFFSFIKKNDADFQENAFPFSLKQFSKEKVLDWLVEFYRSSFLDEAGARQIISRYAVKNNLSPDTLAEDKQKNCFLASLTNNSQLALLLTEFFEYLSNHVAYAFSSKLSETLQTLIQHFSDQKVELEEGLEKRILALLEVNYSTRTVKMIETFSDSQAQELEAEIEFPLHLKIQQAEAYLTKKYPTTEIHFFTNIMRKQRNGQHTPFLVSPEGSMAYSLMLNDFLLNPAAMISGITPMPFDLPKNFKILSSIGVFPDAEWTLKQDLVAEHKKIVKPVTQEGKEGEEEDKNSDNEPILEVETESFVFGKLPNWGEIIIPREMFLEHAMPIFLRESEKISHRNLPKALLNCWWLEMIVCIDRDDELPTSLTRLLWNPDGRYFIRENRKGPLIDAIYKMEGDYPALQLDPWWLKFTEMLVRFESYEQDEEEEPDFDLNTLSETQKNIIFCFAQHMRISDVINFGDDGNPYWLDENATWRSRALVDFYKIFFSIPEDRQILIRFSEGRDDAGNKIEKLLKKNFLESMSRVEKKLCNIGHSRALKKISNQLARLSEKGIEKEKAVEILSPLLDIVNQRVSIEDRKVLVKLKKKIPLNKIEQMQAKIVYEELQELKSVQGNIVDYFKQFSLKMEESWVRRTITNAKVKVAGDPLENVIFKFHFERNFERKPFQVPLPISKSLSIPRTRIKVEFIRKSSKWQFSSMLSRKEAGGGGGADTVMPMFEANLVEGITRCTFSGYVGFGGKYLSTFEKPAAQIHNDIAMNPASSGILFTLASEIKNFFKSFAVSSRELMENIHYIRDVLMVCHVNKLNVISLIARDNLGEQFVINFDISKIDIKKVPPKLKIGGDAALALFFMRLNSPQCRIMFIRHLSALKIPISTSQLPHLQVWVNGSNYNFPIAPKFQQNYLNGIANSLWPHNSIGTREHLKPPPLTKTFDEIGRASLHG